MNNNNNNTTERNIMLYNVTYTSSINGQVITQQYVSSDRINLEKNTFSYNNFYNNEPILRVEAVDQNELDAMSRYFSANGTANE